MKPRGNGKRHILIAVALLVGMATAASAGGFAGIGRISPRTAWDFNPDPNIVETLIVAYPTSVRFGTGNKVPVYTYNGTIPGPTIKGKVGDKLIVHFFNQLPEDTTIHWHGLELPADMDGSNIAQDPVPPGGYFRYEFDLLEPSLFWFHPHIRTNEQVEKGLYGALLVTDKAGDQALGLPRNEHILVLDDVLMDAQGQIDDPFPSDPLANAKMQLDGREGNVLLVNGKQAGGRAILRRGVPHRFRIVNVANTRFMRLSFPGYTVYRIGGDQGLLETPLAISPIGLVPDPDDPSNMISDPDLSKGLLLTPGERADIVITPVSKTLDIEWHDLPRGRHAPFYKTDGTIGIADEDTDGKAPYQTLLKLRFAGKQGGNWTPPAALRTINPIDTTGAGGLMSVFGHTPPDAAGDVTFFVQMKNGMPLPFQAVTPADAPTVTIGETKIWTVRNLTGGHHNFHLHGFKFQLIDTVVVPDSSDPSQTFTVPAPYLEWKDSIFIPQRPGAGGGASFTETRLAVTFDDTGREGEAEAFGKVPGPGFSGGWLFHCHILEHSNRGMMSFLQTMNPVTATEHGAVLRRPTGVSDPGRGGALSRR